MPTGCQVVSYANGTRVARRQSVSVDRLIIKSTHLNGWTTAASCKAITGSTESRLSQRDRATLPVQLKSRQLLQNGTKNPF